MLEAEVAQAFARTPQRVPRATVLCYALAVLHAALAVSWGIYGETARTVALGLIGATAAFGLWVAVGTGVALLAQVADRGLAAEQPVEGAVPAESRPAILSLPARTTG